MAIALALTDIEVGLNGDMAGDPWRRSFASWVPREGFFAREAIAVPALAPVGLALLALGLGIVAALATRSIR